MGKRLRVKSVRVEGLNGKSLFVYPLFVIRESLLVQTVVFDR